MKKFEIFTDRCEIRVSQVQRTTLSPEDILDAYLNGTVLEQNLRASFDTLDEAQAEFKAHWANWGTTRLMRGNAGPYLYCDLAWLEENDYDADGDLEQGHGVLAYSAQGWTNEGNDEGEHSYHVLPEYQDAWYGGLTTEEIRDAIVTEDEIQRLAHEWGVTVEDLMEQVEEV